MAKANDSHSSIHGISAMQPNINANHAPVGEGVRMVEEKCLGYVNLRLTADDKLGASVVKKTLGVELPAISQWVTHKQLTVLGFSPTEWLIITANGEADAVIAQLSEKLADTHHQVTDVSGGTTRLNLSGKHAQDLLEKGTYVDLHDSVFSAGTLYATQIAHAPAVIMKNADKDFSLIVRRSFANHIAHWAIDGAAEFGFVFS